MEVQRAIFDSARDGDLHCLKSLLNNKPPEEVSLLISVRKHGLTPLIVACINGRLHVVSYLIEECRVDVEQAGFNVMFDGKRVDGASPLWCASAFGHFHVVKYLLRYKASVNSKTESNSTPLRAACGFHGRLEIVKCLVEHGADIEIADKTNHTCLMLACIVGQYEISKYLVECGANVNRKCNYGMTALHECAQSGHLDIVKLLLQYGATLNSDSRGQTQLMLIFSRGRTPLMLACREGHYEISKYLVECGADVNRKCDYGRTALHECAKWGHLDILKLLLKNGATLIADNFGKTPQLYAALAGHAVIVEYFLQECNFTRQTKIKGLQILGATFVDQNRDMNLALDFWRRAMELRQDGNFPTENLPRPPPIAACLDATEVRTLSQLEALRLDPDEMRKQALLVRERILGPESTDNLFYIRRRAATYAFDGDLDRSMKLWLYALDAMQMSLDFQTFLEDFSRVSRAPFDRKYMVFCFRVLLRAFERTLKEIERQMSEYLQEEMKYYCCDDTLQDAVYALGLMCELQPLMTQSEELELKKAAYQLVSSNPRTRQGRTTLHVACCPETILELPAGYNPLEVVNLLLEVGASPDALDYNRNTPLHSAVMKGSCTQVLFDTLLNHGAHLDLCNREKKNPLQLVAAHRLDVYPLRHLNLQCLCAKAVQRHKIPYKGWVQKQLEAFVELH